MKVEAGNQSRKLRASNNATLKSECEAKVALAYKTPHPHRIHVFPPFFEFTTAGTHITLLEAACQEEPESPAGAPRGKEEEEGEDIKR